MVKKSNLIGMFFGIVLSLVLVGAAHTITTSTGGTEYSLDEDTNFLYNITVSNTDTGAAANITSVVITLPSSFMFISSSNGASVASASFDETNRVLTWTNNSGLVMGSSSENFWFNASAATAGDFNITVETTNATGTETSDISVEVNDTSAPSAVEFVVPSENWANISADYITYNVSVSDDSAVDTIDVYLYNSTRDLINSSTNTGSSSFYATFSNLSEGIYYMNATANDTLGYANDSVTWTVVLDTTAPTITLGSPADKTSSVTDDYNFTFTPTDSRGIDRCRLRFDGSNVGSLSDVVSGEVNGIFESSISSGTFNWSIWCEDYAGNNYESAERKLTVLSGAAGGSTGTSTGTSVWKNTFVTSSSQFKNGYNRMLEEKERIRVSIDSENHYVGIIDITSTSVKINVSSDPQQSTLKVGDDWKVDVTDNDRYDLMVTLEGIVSNEANITVIEIDEAVPSTSSTSTSTTATESDSTGTSGVSDVDSSEGGSYTWLIVILIVVAVAAAGVAGYLYWKKQRKMMGFE